MLQEPSSPVTDKWPLYTTPDEEAPESEVTDLVTAFVSALKPETVVETGTANGHTAEAIGWQLEANSNNGKLYTFEVDAQKAHNAQKRTRGLPVYVQLKPCRSVDPHEYGPVDMLFIDGVLEERLEEYLHWRPALRNGGIAILHDTLKFGDVCRAIDDHLSTSGFWDEAIWLPTPRGVTIIQTNDTVIQKNG